MHSYLIRLTLASTLLAKHFLLTTEKAVKAVIVGHPYFFIIILMIVNMERIKAVIAVIVGHFLFAFFNGNSNGKKTNFAPKYFFPAAVFP